jgi:hypothetical protein
LKSQFRKPLVGTALVAKPESFWPDDGAVLVPDTSDQRGSVEGFGVGMRLSSEAQ